MPHLDIINFVSQYWWLAISLGLNYININNSVKTAELIKLRKHTYCL